MKKTIIVTLFAGLLLSAWLVIHAALDAPPEGEGSYEAAARIHQELEALRAGLPDLTLPAGYHQFQQADGSWYAATGIDTHSSADGGTVGVLTSDGEIAIFFTHVCGSGEMPLVFPGDSAAEVLANLKAGHKELTP